MTSEEALRRLLTGTHLTYRFTNDTTVTLELQPQEGNAGTIQLDQLYVEGHASSESAYGPVEGFVATRESTGTKTDTPVSEVPQSISVVTRDQMDARGARTVADSLAYSAGVIAGTQGHSSGQGGDSVSIRGFGGRSSSGLSSNEYWDGHRMLGTNFGGGHIDPYLFERIEVLRGPSSVLYGQNQPGGIVNRVSKRPPSEASGEAQVQGGTFDTKELDLDLGGPLTEQATFAYRVVGVLSDQDAQMDFTGRQREALAPSLTWSPTDNTSLTVQATYQNDDIEGGFLQAMPAFGTLFDTPNGRIPRERFGGDPNFNKWDSETYALGYVLEHRFDDTWSVRQNARFVHNEQDIDSIALSSLLPDGRTATRFTFDVTDLSNAATIDNQAEARFTTGRVAHTVLAGLDYQWWEVDDVRGFGAAPNLDLYTPVYFQPIAPPPIFQSSDNTADQIGLYVQDQVKFDRWILTLGGRHDWADSDFTDKLGGTVTRTRDTSFTGRAGLGYAFPIGITPYLSFSQSFEPQTGADFGGDPFEPTSGEQYEAGIKIAPPDYNAFLTLSAFHLTEQNVLTGDPINPGFSIQTGEVRSRGIEVEGVASLASGWNLLASYSYLDQKVTDSSGTDLGMRPTRMPKHMANLWSSYAFGAGGFDGLEIGAGTRYVGGTMGDAANTFSVPPYVLFDASLGYRLSALDPELAGVALAISATNLADNNYVASCDFITICYYGIGRTVVARLRYEW